MAQSSKESAFIQKKKKESMFNAGDHLQYRILRFDPWVEKIPGEGNGSPLQYSCLVNPKDRGAWQATIHGVERVRYNLATKPPSPSLTGMK